MTDNKPKIYVGIILVVIIGVGLWWILKPKKISDQNVKNEKYSDVVYTEEINSSESDKTKEYQIDKFNLVFSYPENWQKNDIEIADVSSPLTKQELASIYAPSNTDESNTVSASGELLRFIIEKDTNINSKDDWYNYVKSKIDSLMEDKDLINQTNYHLISLEKVDDIDGHWTLREDYNHKDGVRGRDYYIFNEDIFQFVFECNSNIYSNYASIFDNVAYSFKFK